MPSSTTVPDPTLLDSDSHDSDFAASPSASDTEASTSSEGEGRVRVKRKRAGGDDALASGDEGVVESGKRKKRRKHKKKGKSKESKALEQEGDDDESDEGVGARLRRRRDGKAEGRASKKKTSDGSMAPNIDIDAIWARMNSAPSAKPIPMTPPDSRSPQNGEAQTEQKDNVVNETSTRDGSGAAVPPTSPANDMISIKRTYTFAGTTTVEEKLVPKDSAEAREYLSSSQPSVPPNPKPNPNPNEPATRSNLRRPLRRPSRFDTYVPTGNDLRTTLAAIKAPLAAAAAAAAAAAQQAPTTSTTTTTTNTTSKSQAEQKLEKGQKLNTVEKSRLDWAGYVDKEKLKDELDQAEKAKGGYLDRMDFLGRSDAARDEAFKEGRKR